MDLTIVAHIWKGYTGGSTWNSERRKEATPASEQRFHFVAISLRKPIAHTHRRADTAPSKP